jgi:two-component system, NtrC family, sensor kinase
MQRPKTLKRRNAPKVAHRRKPSAADAGKIALLEQKLNEALEQQTATSEILKVISGSPGHLEPVFKAMLEKAVRICEAKFGVLWLCENGGFRLVAQRNTPPAFAEHWRTHPVVHPVPGTGLRRLAETRQVAHIADMTKIQPYIERDPFVVSSVELGDFRTVVNVPMLKESELVGAIAIYRQEVRPFTEKQIELVTNFAAQAVIAIENTRLLNELRRRTDDLSEALEQQTATSEVLQVISSTPGELEPVFQAMLEKAVRICDANFGNLYLREGDAFRIGATYGASPAYVEFVRTEQLFHLNPKVGLGRLVRTKELYHVADISAVPTHGDKLREATIKLAGARTLIALPMLKDNEVIGAIVIYRQEVRPFTDKQIELVKNFAAQAVIAIENTRLLNELRESLQQQTATSDVLKVISSSPADIQPVLESILQTAGRLCEAEYACFFRLQDGKYHLAGSNNAKADYIKYLSEHPINIDRGTVVGRAAVECRTVHIPDCLADPEYTAHENARIGKHRSLLGVPMLRDGTAAGVIGLLRTSVKPYTDKQVELVETFADQAIIAIENTRLLNELRESLQQQTATADVLKVISRSTFDLQTVLNTLTESAARLCEADRGVILQREGDVYCVRANYGFSREAERYALEHPLRPDRGSLTGRVSLEGRTIHIPDVLDDPEYRLTDYQKKFGYRTSLGVPLLREREVIGVLSLHRDEVNPFTEKQIELVTTFADQAVIAIENARLFGEVQARTRELTTSLENLRATQDRLVQTQKLASLGQLTAGIAHEIKNPLNFVNNFSGISAELIDELQDTVKGISLDDKARAEITELTDTLRGNLDKVMQHGKRADSIVKNMLLHSREGSAEHRVIDINAIVEESLNLAYHGARAEKQNFNITLQRTFDSMAGEADLFPQDITRALLNFISNGFYAATKRHAETNGGTKPTLAAATKNLGDRVEITIRDNGTGMPPDVKDKMFNPFFTTKPAGEGTGLGLSISHDIIVKQHGGSIEVDTQPGEFTEIKVILPRVAALLPERS